MTGDAKSPGQVIGECIRSVRENAGERQDELAARARDYGLRWTRATVAALETGRRELNLGEAFLLPSVLGVTLAELFPPDAQVRVAPDATMTGAGIRSTLAGEELTFADMDVPASRSLEQGFRSLTRLEDALKAQIDAGERVWPQATARDALAARRDAEQEVERRAAERLGVDARFLALAARRRWGHSLTAERDRRTPPGVTSAGHVTRQLLAELRPTLEAAGLIDQKEA